MSTVTIIKIFSMLLALALVITSLILLGKKKEQFQKYPDQIKKELYKSARVMTILNIVAVVIVVLSYSLISSNLFFFPILLSMVLSSQSLLFHLDDFDNVD